MPTPAHDAAARRARDADYTAAAMQSLWMLASSLLFALMAACVKLAAARYHTAEILFFRSIVGVLLLFSYARYTGLSLSTSLAGMHARRSLIGLAALALWFHAIGKLPLGTAMTLNFSSSIFSTAFVVGAALAARRRVSWPLAACVGLGFVGVVLILRPSFAAGSAVPALLGLLSGFLSAVAYWHVRELGRIGEPEWRTVFYFSLCGAIAGLLGTVVFGFTPPAEAGDYGLLLAVGVFATLAQLAMTRAYGRGRTMLTANLQFAAIVFAALLGIALFGDAVPAAGWAGIATIVASCVGATALVARQQAPVVKTTIAAADR